MDILNDELELVKSLTSILASFKEDPSMGAGGRQKSSASKLPHSKDPDVWPPPTPLEPRYYYK